MEHTTEDRFDVVDVPGRDRQGRSWYSDEAKRSYLKRYHKSGLSQRAFCEREGLKLPTFSSWLRRESIPEPSMKFRRLELSGPVPLASSLEVVMPGGMVLKGHDAAQLAALVRLLQAS
jgi:hypothetical protein